MLQWDRMMMQRSVSLCGGIYLLGKLSNIIHMKIIGLYRFGRLPVNANGPKHNCLRKDVVAIFQNEGLKITIDTNSTTDFLDDVTLNLFIGKYYPYQKPKDCPLYVNANPNHPLTILKQLPQTVNTRL